MIEVSAFTWVPPFAQGLVRDLRVRWALAQAGIFYTVRLLGPGENGGEQYRRLQPFGQVPTWAQLRRPGGVEARRARTGASSIAGCSRSGRCRRGRSCGGRRSRGEAGW